MIEEVRRMHTFFATSFYRLKSNRGPFLALKAYLRLHFQQNLFFYFPFGTTNCVLNVELNLAILKKNIVQFVCFETTIDFEKFIGNWEHYAKKFESKEVKTSLLEQVNVKSRYKYVSQHMASPDELQFTFMKEKRSVILPESKIKVIQAGGYKPLQTIAHQPDSNDSFKILLFVPKSVYDIEPFKKMDFLTLHVFEAYFESCNYSYVLEFIVKESAGEEIMKEIKSLLHNPDVGMYKEALVLQG